MKETELRIGNLAQNIDGELLKCIGIKEDEHSWYVLDRSKYPLQKGWEVQPIPLTEELFKRFGFEEDKLIALTLTKNYCRISIVKGNIYMYTVVGGNGIEIRYVHQLQNLYFALTGDELQLEETPSTGKTLFEQRNKKI